MYILSSLDENEDVTILSMAEEKVFIVDTRERTPRSIWIQIEHGQSKPGHERSWEG